MQRYRLGYGRVYPESGYPWEPWDADKRLFPFYTMHTMLAKDGGKTYDLWTIEGVNNSGFVPEKLYAGSRSFEQRGWQRSDREGSQPDMPLLQGIDARGQATDGTRWRRLSSMFSNTAGYSNVPPHVADYFDQILDSMCY